MNTSLYFLVDKRTLEHPEGAATWFIFLSTIFAVSQFFMTFRSQDFLSWYPDNSWAYTKVLSIVCPPPQDGLYDRVRRSPSTSIPVPLIVRSTCFGKTFPLTDDRLSLHFKLPRSAISLIFECIDKICTQVRRESLNNTYLRYLCHLCVTVCAAIIPPTGSNDLSEMYTSICSWYVFKLYDF